MGKDNKKNTRELGQSPRVAPVVSNNKVAGNEHKAWSESMLTDLVRLYPHYSILQIASALEVSDKIIQEKAEEYRLPRKVNG